MTESSSFTSLLALVDSHLSKTNLQESRSEDSGNKFPLPNLNGIRNGTLSDTGLSIPCGQRIPLPTISLGESPIQKVLAEQVSNMLKAKERQQEEEQKRLEEEEKRKIEERMRKINLKEDNYVIDLAGAIQKSIGPAPPKKVEMLSSSSSFESLFDPQFIDCDVSPELIASPELLLPCKTDMSYILSQKICKGKCSPFGKVLSSRLRPVAAPYFHEKVENRIVRFKFNTPSPCDLIKEKLRRPTMHTSFVPDILNFV